MKHRMSWLPLAALIFFITAVLIRPLDAYASDDTDYTEISTLKLNVNPTLSYPQYKAILCISDNELPSDRRYRSERYRMEAHGIYGTF